MILRLNKQIMQSRKDKTKKTAIQIPKLFKTLAPQHLKTSVPQLKRFLRFNLLIAPFNSKPKSRIIQFNQI